MCIVVLKVFTKMDVSWFFWSSKKQVGQCSESAALVASFHEHIIRVCMYICLCSQSHYKTNIRICTCDFMASLQRWGRGVGCVCVEWPRKTENVATQTYIPPLSKATKLTPLIIVAVTIFTLFSVKSCSGTWSRASIQDNVASLWSSEAKELMSVWLAIAMVGLECLAFTSGGLNCKRGFMTENIPLFYTAHP